MILMDAQTKQLIFNYFYQQNEDYVDIYTDHFYEPFTMAMATLTRDAAKTTAANKVYVVGEYGLIYVHQYLLTKGIQ